MESLRPATDVYGLGAILFALLTGEPPVEGGAIDKVLDCARRGAIRSPRAFNLKIPRALEAICLKALRLKPRDRYLTVRTCRRRRALVGRRAGGGMARAAFGSGTAVGAAASAAGDGLRGSRAGGRRGIGGRHGGDLGL